MRKLEELNKYNFYVARAMMYYWHDVCEGKLPRVLWEQLEDRIREHYIVLSTSKPISRGIFEQC